MTGLCVGSDVHFSDDLAWRGRNDAAHRHPRADGDVGWRHLRGETITDEPNSIGVRTCLERRRIDEQQRRIGRRPLHRHVEAQFVVLSPEPASIDS